MEYTVIYDIIYSIRLWLVILFDIESEGYSNEKIFN